jgi:hypothetical protein
MKLPEVKGNFPNSTNFTVIVENVVPEYQPPIIGNIMIRDSWDAYRVEDTLELLDPDGLWGSTEPVLQAAHERWMNRQKVDRLYHFATSDNAYDSTYYEITFWLPEHRDFARQVTEYLQHFREYLENLWTNRGGDGDYYDYLPSITDIFYALCEFFEAPRFWDEFLDWLIKEEGERVLSESLYRH